MRQRHIFLLTIFLCASSLWAGEQLSSAELVKRSVAIADVTVQWDTTHAQPKITLEAWLKAPEAKNLDALQAQPDQLQKWIGLCLPDQNLLAHWLKTYPHFKKNNRAQWQNALTQRSYRSLVFIGNNPATGALEPTCETEALLTRGWQSHEESAAYRNQIKAEILKQRPEKRFQTVTPPSPPKVPETKPNEKRGCGCRSTA